MLIKRPHILIQDAMEKAIELVRKPEYEYYPHVNYYKEPDGSFYKFNLVGAMLGSREKPLVTVRFLRYISLGMFAETDNTEYYEVWALHNRQGAPMTWDEPYKRYLRDCVAFWRDRKETSI